MANYSIGLNSTPKEIEDGDGLLIQINAVKLGWNQLGWLCFEDEKTREQVAGFPPGVVRFFLRVEDAADAASDGIIDVEVTDATTPKIQLVN